MESFSGQAVNLSLTGVNAGRSTGGSLYGSGGKAVILSNMNTNSQDEWQPLLAPLTDLGCRVLTYSYLDPEADQWEVLADAITYLGSLGAEKIALIGASRGGVTSMQVLARSSNTKSIVGVAAVSSPVAHEGATFFQPEELAGITIPKLFINTEGDECAAGTREMFGLVSAPKEMVFYPGDGHGTEIFSGPCGGCLVRRLSEFTKTVLEM